MKRWPHPEQGYRACLGLMSLGACRELAPSKQESTTYEPSLVCKLLILGCRLLIPDRLLGRRSGAERLEAASARALHLQSYSYRTVKNILSSAQDRLPFGDTETPPTPHHDNIRGAAYYADPEETHSC